MEREERMARARTRNMATSLLNLRACLTGQATPLAKVIEEEGGIAALVDALMAERGALNSDWPAGDATAQEAETFYRAAFYCGLADASYFLKEANFEDFIWLVGLGRPVPNDPWNPYAKAHKSVKSNFPDETPESYLDVMVINEASGLVGLGFYDAIAFWNQPTTGVIETAYEDCPEHERVSKFDIRTGLLSVPSEDGERKLMMPRDTRLISPEMRIRCASRLREDMYRSLDTRLLDPEFCEQHAGELLGRVIAPEGDPGYWFDLVDYGAALDEEGFPDESQRVIMERSTGLFDPETPLDISPALLTVGELEAEINRQVERWLGTDSDYDAELYRQLEVLAGFYEAVPDAEGGVTYRATKCPYAVAYLRDQAEATVNSYLLQHGYVPAFDPELSSCAAVPLDKAAQAAYQVFRQLQEA